MRSDTPESVAGANYTFPGARVLFPNPVQGNGIVAGQHMNVKVTLVHCGVSNVP